MANVDYTMRKLTHDVKMTITYKLSKEFKIRRWIAVNLIRLATLVLGCGLEVVDNDPLD